MKVSFQCGKSFNREHNNRTLVAENVDVKRSCLNEIIMDRTLLDSFTETFSDSLDEFNLKQKKNPKRRKTIDQYYGNNKESAREVIIQLGNEDEQIEPERAKSYLEEAYELFKKNNQSLHIFGAYIHMDEATPHIHIDFFPVAHSKKGMRLKPSLSGALAELGFERGEKYDDREFVKWQDHNRNELETLAEKYASIERHETKSVEHMRIAAYKRKKFKEEIPKLEDRLASLEKEIESKTIILNNLNARIKKAKLYLNYLRTKFDRAIASLNPIHIFFDTKYEFKENEYIHNLIQQDKEKIIDARKTLDDIDYYGVGIDEDIIDKNA